LRAKQHSPGAPLAPRATARAGSRDRRFAAAPTRKEQSAPVDEGELTGDGRGDPALLPVVIPPDGWIGDLEDPEIGLICGACARVEEIAAWMAVAATAETLDLFDAP
jgi:hypothetical protein